MATRWGIASAGKISHDFVTALGTLPKEEHVVVAVCARHLESAREFATRHGIPQAYGSYEELAKDPNIDVVYIGSINSQHFNHGKLMLENGKPILLEKPLTLNLKQSTCLINLARSKKLFVMEAIWSRFFPAYDLLKREIESGSLGEVKQVIANFGVPINQVERIKQKELGGGSILDLGVYTIQFAVFVFGLEMPEVVAFGHLNEEGVDNNAAAIFKYKDGKIATISCNANVLLPNEAFVVGTKGTAKVSRPFWCPTNVIVPDKTCDFILPPAGMPFNFENSAGLRYEAMEVRRCLKQGLLESPKMPHAESLLIAELEDKIRKQVGVVFDEDV